MPRIQQLRAVGKQWKNEEGRVKRQTIIQRL
jgi:hypothetical protein